LPPQDRLVLRLRFDEGMAVAGVAKTLHLDQKPLYRRIERLLFQLRGQLEAAGLQAADVVAALGSHGFEDIGRESAGEVRPFQRGETRAEREKVS
jgi:hypothetical protein